VKNEEVSAVATEVTNLKISKRLTILKVEDNLFIRFNKI